MYCKNCGFHSFDHLKNCPKCDQEWEQTRKDLGLQWIEETKGDWLEAIEETDAAAEPSTLSPTSQQDAFLQTAEEDFTLEEDWLLPEMENQAPKKDEEKEFVFTEEGAASPRQPSLDLPTPPTEPTMTEVDEEPVDDLLIPGLEEMLLAAGKTSAQPSSQSQTDQSADDLVLIAETTRPQPIDSMDFFPEQEKSHIADASMDVALDAISHARAPEKNDADTIGKTKEADPDIVEINLEDLEFSLEEDTKKS